MYAVVISIINQSNTLESKFFENDDEKELTEENGISITDMGKMSIFLNCYLEDSLYKCESKRIPLSFSFDFSRN